MSSSTSKFKSAPTYSFKGRNKTITSSNDPAILPSPLQYTPEKMLKKAPQVRFAQSERKPWEEVRVKSEYPGPGQFDTGRDFLADAPKRTIGKAVYKDMNFQTPSPGSYQPNSIVLLKKSPSFSMQKKHPSMIDILARRGSNNPSPADYQHPETNFKSSLQITMAKSKRKSVVLSPTNPGPGAYETDKSFNSVMSSLSKCKIGRSERKIDFSRSQLSPGPGQYERKSSFEENKMSKKGFTCRDKFQPRNPAAEVPGPGQYETPIMKRFKSSPLIQMAKSTRRDFIDQNIRVYDNPGPGEFNPEGADKLRFKSSSVHRFPKNHSNYITETIRSQSSRMTAPGYYSVNPEAVLKSGPKISITQSKIPVLFNSKNITPSPGDYDPKIQLLYQSEFIHKLQTSQRPNPVKHLMQNPGPGDYEVTAIERSGRSFKFPQDKRVDRSQEKVIKEKSELPQTYEERQKFPNVPSYVKITPKLSFNEHKMGQYAVKKTVR